MFYKAGTKLHKCFFIGAKVKKVDGKELFLYAKIMKLSGFFIDRFITTIEIGDTFIDFDARTGHNHGTKCRFKHNRFHELYEHVEEI